MQLICPYQSNISFLSGSLCRIVFVRYISLHIFPDIKSRYQTDKGETNKLDLVKVFIENILYPVMEKKNGNRIRKYLTELTSSQQMAIGPRRWGASCPVMNMAVGPSAPPIIPIEAASCTLKPSVIARIKAQYIPS
jgi:hypothetical protein